MTHLSESLHNCTVRRDVSCFFIVLSSTVFLSFTGQVSFSKLHVGNGALSLTFVKDKFTLALHSLGSNSSSVSSDRRSNLRHQLLASLFRVRTSNPGALFLQDWHY